LTVAVAGDACADRAVASQPTSEVPMTENPGEPDRPFHDPEPSLGGPDVAAAVDNAESGTENEGAHRPAPPGAEGESRLEQMREVDEE
jgi:hypothetical protein